MKKILYIILNVSLLFSFASASWSSVEEKLHGKWGWNLDDLNANCSGNPHEFKFSKDGKSFIVEFLKEIPSTDGTNTKIVFYNILSKTKNTITATIKGESRKTVNGESVIWDLIIVTSTKYVWHRQDWGKGLVTPEIIKCKNLTTRPEVDNK